MRRILLASILSVTLSACWEEKTHDVDYYLDNPDERSAKLEECKNNPGERRVEPNCVNAAEAQRRAGFQGNEIPSFD